MQLPVPQQGTERQWVRNHLADLCSSMAASPRFRGTQAAADSALAAFDVTGYATRRSEVWPSDRRGASGLSPWIRHGLLTLPRVWESVGGHGRDTTKFRDELRWQEYARHLYARLGTATDSGLRYESTRHGHYADPWDSSMACIDAAVKELEHDGWLVNQMRMWLASQWTVRHGAPWRDGEDRFFRQLLDGSRAANRLGWQWVMGTATGKPYGFSRRQVLRRAPGLCDTCVHREACPIEGWPEAEQLRAVPLPDPRLYRDENPEVSTGPESPVIIGTPNVVWLTGESLGDDDPALAAYPELPVVFVFDEVLLRRLQLAGKRLIFLTERLAELSTYRQVEVHRSDAVTVLAGRAVATTFAPVPGWRQRSAAIAPVGVFPWPWLLRPTAGSVASFSAWSRRSTPP
jgi:deoxyribodipyrimidine photo-lyase